MDQIIKDTSPNWRLVKFCNDDGSADYVVEQRRGVEWACYRRFNDMSSGFALTDAQGLLMEKQREGIL